MNMSNKENNSAILQGVMCHLLTEPIPKKWYKIIMSFQK